MHVTYFNNDYVRTHGKNPRGTGSWVFTVRYFLPNARKWKSEIYSAYGSLTEARHQVLEKVKKDFEWNGGAAPVSIETMG